MAIRTTHAEGTVRRIIKSIKPTINNTQCTLLQILKSVGLFSDGYAAVQTGVHTPGLGVSQTHVLFRSLLAFVNLETENVDFL